MPAKSNLSFREEQFVREYISNGFNATRATLAVYPQKYTSARVTGCRLLTKANIRTAVRARTNGIMDESTFARVHAELLNSNDKKVALRALGLAYKILGKI